MPQCQSGPGPDRQEKPRLPHSPGLSLRPRFVWFRGLGTLSPHPTLWLLGSLGDPAGVCWWVEGKRRVGFPPFRLLSTVWSPVSNRRWGERLGVIGWWGWLGNLFSPFSLLASPFLWRRGEGESEWSVVLAGELVSPASPP